MFFNRNDLTLIRPCLECDSIPKVGVLVNKDCELETFTIECRNGCTGVCEDTTVEKSIALWNKYWKKKEEYWAQEYYKDYLAFEDLKEE